MHYIVLSSLGCILHSVFELCFAFSNQMEKPVRSVHRIRKCLSSKEKLLNVDASTRKADQLLPPKKKAKVIAALPVSISMDTTLYEGEA